MKRKKYLRVNSKFKLFSTIGILSLGLLSCASNSRVVQLNYMGENCYPESLIRVYTNDSVFLEYRLKKSGLGNVYRKVDTFKVVEDNWYRKNCDKFNLFFSPESFEKGDTIVNKGYYCSNVIFKYIPIRKIIINNRLLYEYRMQGQHYDYFAPTILFDPFIGKVSIKFPTSFGCAQQELFLESDEYLSRQKIRQLLAPFKNYSIPVKEEVTPIDSSSRNRELPAGF